MSTSLQEDLAKVPVQKRGKHTKVASLDLFRDLLTCTSILGLFSMMRRVLRSKQLLKPNPWPAVSLTRPESVFRIRVWSEMDVASLRCPAPSERHLISLSAELLHQFRICHDG